MRRSLGTIDDQVGYGGKPIKRRPKFTICHNALLYSVPEQNRPLDSRRFCLIGVVCV